MAKAIFLDPLAKILPIVEKDPRYHPNAYLFIFEALEYTILTIGERRHVTGQELLEGFRELAINKFGKLAKFVLNRWGIRSTKDVGEIVFNLVEENLMGKTETDSREDFADGYDFDKAFDYDIELPKEWNTRDSEQF